MANVSDWSANEKDNLFLDELNLSDQHGRRTAKIMAAVKAKEDEQDAKLDAVAGGLVFRGTKATYADLEAVEDPAVGDMYSVTELGGENYAWDGEAWDTLGTSDANVVHKTGDETISGTKSFSSGIVLNDTANSIKKNVETQGVFIIGGAEETKNPRLGLVGYNSSINAAKQGCFNLYAANASASKEMLGKPDGTLTWDGQAIQTSSDERLKTPLAAVPDAVLDAWGDVEWGQFQYLDAVASKGGGSARLHLGLIAQRVSAVFEARGMDACAYGILCHEVSDATEDEPAVDQWMVRYAEALAMEAACQRRRADRLESRICALEEAVYGN